MTDSDPVPKPLTREKPRRTQKERRANTRMRLLEAAAAEITRNGFHRFTLDAVARRARMSTGALRHEFGSKADLTMAVLSEHLFPVLRSVRLESQAGKTLAARCAAVIEVRWRMLGNPNYLLAWELMLGARGESGLREQVLSFLMASSDALLGDMEAALDGLVLERSKMREINSFMINQMRGMALVRPYVQESEFYSNQLHRLQRLMEQEIRACMNKGVRE